jgi:hypothetical protein
MNLSIASATPNSSSLPALGRGQAAADEERPAPLPSTSENGQDETTRSESATQRPTRETQESSGLTEEEQRQVEQLQQRDREVKAHELAHKAVGGRYVVGGSFTYQTGPDGHRYAIGGEVSIDSSSESTPQETLRKADLIRRAALAPADPSPQDHRVASQAAQMAAEARSEISAEQREKIMQEREARVEQQEESSAENESGTPLQNQRAIASFEAIGGISQLQSNPDPIDEMV